MSITPASIEWKDSVPVSQQYADVYFSRQGGLEESRHVFLQGNDLPRRWQGHDGSRSFLIAETGFGTGLNFLAASLAWLECVKAPGVLHYLAVEKYPLSKPDLIKALAVYPPLANLAQELIQEYPLLVGGLHRRYLFSGRVCLDLYFMDVQDWLNELNICADAWFLDGFAPSKNRDMWSDPVLTRIGVLTAANGTFATFTAAGQVRRSLQAAGFAVAKLPGYGDKREMLAGKRDAVVIHRKESKPWYLHSATPVKQRKAIIVGAGLAGAFTANVLAQKGWQVTVLERENGPAQGASGNAAAVIYSRFSPHAGLEYGFYQQSYLSAVHCYSALGLSEEIGRSCGVLQLGFDDKERERQSVLMQAQTWPPELMRLVSAAEASELAGITLEQGGLFFPQAGWVAPARLCEYLLRHAAIRLQTSAAVATLEYDPATGWSLFDAAGRQLGSAEIVVIANAADAVQFRQTDHLPLHRIRGQLSYVPANAASAALRTVLCFDGYVTPSIAGQHSIGATFDHGNNDTDLSMESHERNLRHLQNNAPVLHQAMVIEDKTQLGGRAGFRTYTPDHLPMVGPVPDLDFYKHCYAPLGKGERRKFPQAKYCPGLYLNVAHGTRGVTTAPLAAEIIAAYVENRPQPVPESLRQALHPGRFIIRQLRKGGS